MPHGRKSFSSGIVNRITVSDSRSRQGTLFVRSRFGSRNEVRKYFVLLLFESVELAGTTGAAVYEALLMYAVVQCTSEELEVPDAEVCSLIRAAAT